MIKNLTRKILLVEDDPDIAHLVEIHLQDIECEVTLSANGLDGLRQGLANDYDLIILDLMLPGMEGLELCKRLRAKSNYTPILILTAKSSELDRVLGLEFGADDYLTKPFSIRELLARIKAIFRRVEAFQARSDMEEPQLIHAGALVIDTGRRKVTLQGKTLNLTAKEFDLLLQFVQHRGRVYTRAQLLDLVWGNTYEGYEHTVNSHINRLRIKIEQDPAHPNYILTVWGVGYKFADLNEIGA